jgi:hypothetical protein
MPRRNRFADQRVERRGADFLEHRGDVIAARADMSGSERVERLKWTLLHF